MSSVQKKLKQELHEQIIDPLDDKEIRDYLPDAKILTYNQLENIRKIEELLPNDKSYFFLLYLDSPNSGHWTVLSRYKNTIEFYCSYGSKPDAPLLWLSYPTRVELKTNIPYLTKLLNDATNRFKVVYNPIQYQSKISSVATCGRHGVYRIKCLLQKNLTLEKYYTHMNRLKRSGLTNDEIISLFVFT